MSEIKANDSSPTEDSGDETDWAATKAFFDNLKTHKPRPVSVLVKSFVYVELVCSRHIRLLRALCGFLLLLLLLQKGSVIVRLCF